MGIFAQTVATVRSTAVPNFSPPHSDSLLPMSRNVVPTLQSDPADFTYAVYYTHAHFLIRTHARTHAHTSQESTQKLLGIPSQDNSHCRILT